MSDNLSKIKRTSQAIDNFGFDEEYLKPAVEILTENAAGTALTTQKTIATEETLQSMADPTALYKLSDVDEGEPTYMGYVKSDGGWYIARIENGTTFRYARGSSGYNWSNRAEKEYNTFNNIFS